MKPEPETDNKNLLERVRAAQLHIASYVNKVEPRGNRLTSFGIACSVLATLLTAGPAIGGESFTKALGAAGPNSPSWRILCGGDSGRLYFIGARRDGGGTNLCGAAAEQKSRPSVAFQGAHDLLSGIDGKSRDSVHGGGRGGCCCDSGGLRFRRV